jgi:hypothetical protein
MRKKLEKEAEESSGFERVASEREIKSTEKAEVSADTTSKQERGREKG